MSGFSNYTQAAIINGLLRGIAMPAAPINSLHVALFTGDPTNAFNPAVEVPSGSWYSRQPVSTWSAPLIENGETVTRNMTEIKFPVVTGAAVKITHAAIMDARTGGNMLLSDALKREKTLEEDDVLAFAIGAMSFTLKQLPK